MPGSSPRPPAPPPAKSTGCYPAFPTGVPNRIPTVPDTLFFPRPGSVRFRNEHHAIRVDIRQLRRVTRTLLAELLHREHFDLAIYLVGIRRITELNERWLKHQGRTDVITFDYHDPASPDLLSGEIFICLDEAVAQAKRFRIPWQTELVRYVVHGILHLCGFDDQRKQDRNRMKREENRLLATLSAQFKLRKTAVGA